MHNGMQYDPIQGQGHKPLKVRNPPIFVFVFVFIRRELTHNIHKSTKTPARQDYQYQAKYALKVAIKSF